MAESLATLPAADVAHTMSDAAREKIAEMIFQGELPPGAAIDERSLAARFEMSRTPIREALHQLQAQGLVRTVPRQGIYVARLSVKNLLNMLETLQGLEVACVRLAARRISAAGRHELERTCEWTERVALEGDAKAYEVANIAFHRVLYDAANNRYLTDHIELIRRRMALFRRDVFGQPGRLKVSSAEHRVICSTVVADDPQGAEQTMRKHIIVAGAGFAELIAGIPEGFLES